MHLSLAQLYEQLNDLDQAIAYRERHLAYLRSIGHTEHDTYARELERLRLRQQ